MYFYVLNILILMILFISIKPVQLLKIWIRLRYLMLKFFYYRHRNFLGRFISNIFNKINTRKCW